MAGFAASCFDPFDGAMLLRIGDDFGAGIGRAILLREKVS
jgi:hypothetical protein